MKIGRKVPSVKETVCSRGCDQIYNVIIMQRAVARALCLTDIFAFIINGFY